jgi:Uma2 family endonuclease
MADTAQSRLPPANAQEFLVWEEAQPDKHEFRSGVVVLMTGGTQAHAWIMGNIATALRQKLKGRACRPFSSDARVSTDTGAVYYPDVVIDCGPFAANALSTSLPTVVFEVLSPGTRADDFSEKLPNYQATASIREVVYVETDLMRVFVWRRDESGWTESEITSADEPLVLDAVGVSLPMAEIYEDATFTG